MQLKKILPIVGSIAMLAAAGFSSQALAADGTITFSGKIVNTTCNVTTGTNGDFTVTLPTVTANTTSGNLQASGDTAGDTAFSIDLTGCPASPSGVQVASEFSGSNIDTGTGNLDNNAGTTPASNVQVQLLQNDDSTALDLSGGSASAQNSPYVAISSSGTATLKYYARYYATGTAGAGNVQTTADYTLVYQ